MMAWIALYLLGIATAGGLRTWMHYRATGVGRAGAGPTVITAHANRHAVLDATLATGAELHCRGCGRRSQAFNGPPPVSVAGRSAGLGW